jgi:hypothetical protein
MLWVTLSAALAAPALAQAREPGDALRLPPLSSAQRYNLAPSSRELRPEAVRTTTAVNADFVTAASAASETDGHDLDAGPSSSRARVGGVWVRRAGPDEPRAEFSYRLRTPKGGGTLRIEEAGAEDSRYDILVDGIRIATRSPKPEQRGTYGGLVGLVHYDVKLPRLRRETFTLTFRNASRPGPGARIANVWVQGGDVDAPYGGSVSNPSALTNGRGATELRTDLFGRPYVIYDFGREVGGTVSVKATNLGGAPRLAFAFSESEQFMTSASDFSADPVGVVDETQVVRVPKGTSTVEAPQLRGGFRYLMLYLTGRGAVRLSDLNLHFTAAPLQRDLRDYAGAFLSSDDELNRLWYAGAYTVQMSTIDPSTGRRYPAEPGPAYNDAKVADGPSAIVDAPKRDRFVWGGDLAVANPVAYLTTGDTTSPRASFEWLARKPSASGEPAGVYLPLPGDTGWNYSWGEYAAWWMVNYETHYRYTGDRAFLDRWFSQLQGAVSWFESHVGADGLVDVPDDAGGHWGYGHSGKESYDNALYVHALAFAARAAEAENRADLAAAWRAQATRTAQAINDTLWDGTAYKVGLDDPHHAQDGNAMALLAGVATGDRAEAVRRFLAGLDGPFGPLTVDAPGGAVPQYVSPFVTSFQLETADPDTAIGLLRRTWSPMLRGDTTGTFLENVSTGGGPQLGSYTSYSHGWAAAPTSYLTTKVLGVQPDGAGFSSFTVAPQPGRLQWAEGAVPTPHGTIEVAFKRSGGRLQLHVEAPPGTTYSATRPGGEPRTGLTGTTDLEAGR